MVFVTPVVTQNGKVIQVPDRFSGSGQSLPRLGAARFGPCKRDNDPFPDDVSSLCIGSMIALSIDNRGAGSSVTAFSAGRTGSDGNPDWQKIGQWSFSRPLVRQGFRGAGDVLFAGPRIAGKLERNGLPGEAATFATVR